MDVSHGKKFRVLLVGRDFYQINTIRAHLSELDLECESVMDIDTARQVLSSRFMDVMALDSTLESPDTGRLRDLLEGFKSDHAGTSIVVYNGVSNRTLKRRLRRHGADGYISTNNDMKSVAASIRRVLDL